MSDNPSFCSHNGTSLRVRVFIFPADKRFGHMYWVPDQLLVDFDQLSEDLILTNQCHFKFSRGRARRGGGGVKANTIETGK